MTVTVEYTCMKNMVSAEFMGHCAEYIITCVFVYLTLQVTPQKAVG